MGGRYAAVDNIDQLRAMPWSEQSPLRCVVYVGGWGGSDAQVAAALVREPRLFPLSLTRNLPAEP